MEVDENRFKNLEKNVEDIRSFLLGSEYRENGVKQRLEKLEYKEKKQRKYWWLLVGGFTVLIFILKWGENFLLFLK